MCKTYLVDIENIGLGFEPYIDNMLPGDSLILFHTKIQNKFNISIPPEILKKLCQKGIHTHCIKCHTGAPGDNALDFQLASELGAHIAEKAPQSEEYVIISRDRGFEIVSEYWSKLGLPIICRSDPSQIWKPIDQKSKQTKQCRGYYVSVCIAAGVSGKVLDQVVDIMMEGMTRPKSDRLRYIMINIRTKIHPKTSKRDPYIQLQPYLHEIKEKGPYPETMEPDTKD